MGVRLDCYFKIGNINKKKFIHLLAGHSYTYLSLMSKCKNKYIKMYYGDYDLYVEEIKWVSFRSDIAKVSAILEDKEFIVVVDNSFTVVEYTFINGVYKQKVFTKQEQHE